MSTYAQFMMTKEPSRPLSGSKKAHEGTALQRVGGWVMGVGWGGVG